MSTSVAATAAPSDAAAAPQANAGSPDAAPASSAAPAASSGNGTLLDASGDIGSESVAAAGDFDWRAAGSRGDAKKAAVLARYKDLGTLVDSLIEKENRIRKGLPVAPGEGASEEEVAAFRQAIGIPETPDSYAIEGEWGDADKPGLDAFKAIAHSANMTPAQVNAAAKWYRETVAAVTEAQEAAAAEAAKATKIALMEEMGPRDFERNVKLANQFLHDRLGEKAGEFTRLKLADGTALGNNPDFLRMVMGMARDFAGDDLVAAVEAPDAKSVDAKLQELFGLMNTDKARYQSKAVQDEIIRLTKIQDMRAQRRAA